MAAALLGPSCARVALEAGLGVGGGLLLCSATASDSRRVPSSLAALIAAFSSLVRRWGCSSFGASGLGPVYPIGHCPPGDKSRALRATTSATESAAAAGPGRACFPTGTRCSQESNLG